jgi:hypothetical protein
VALGERYEGNRRELKKNGWVGEGFVVILGFGEGSWRFDQWILRKLWQNRVEIEVLRIVQKFLLERIKHWSSTVFPQIKTIFEKDSRTTVLSSLENECYSREDSTKHRLDEVFQGSSSFEPSKLNPCLTNGVVFRRSIHEDSQFTDHNLLIIRNSTIAPL